MPRDERLLAARSRQRVGLTRRAPGGRHAAPSPAGRGGDTILVKSGMRRVTAYRRVACVTGERHSLSRWSSRSSIGLSDTASWKGWPQLSACTYHYQVERRPWKCGFLPVPVSSNEVSGLAQGMTSSSASMAGSSEDSGVEAPRTAQAASHDVVVGGYIDDAETLVTVQLWRRVIPDGLAPSGRGHDRLVMQARAGRRRRAAQRSQWRRNPTRPG